MTPTVPASPRRSASLSSGADNIFKNVIIGLSSVVLIATVLYGFVLIVGGFPALQKDAIGFLFGLNWDPGQNIYQAFPFIAGTFFTALGALVIAATLGIGFYAGQWIKPWVQETWSGWFGKGPGEGTVKRILPDAHTDFIFAVTAEEFGIVVCLALVFVFALVVIRALLVAQKNEDPFCRLAVTGLAMLFGAQAAINMMVNVHLMPAKGMTLPFISYGGSSLLALAIGMGSLVALTRRRPRAETLDIPHPGDSGRTAA